MSYAEVAVNAPTPYHQTFTYFIPPHMQLSVGQPVWVPFGARQVQGIVFAITEDAPNFETRDVDAVVDHQPILSPVQVQLARWLGQYYIAPFFDCASLMMPPGFQQKVLTFFQANPDPNEAASSTLNQVQKEIIYFLQGKGKVERAQLRKTVDEGMINQLVRKGLVIKTNGIARPRVGPKMERYLRLVEMATDTDGSTVKQKALTAILEDAHGPFPMGEIRRMGFSKSVIQGLIQRGLVTVEAARIHRDPLAHRVFPPTEPPILTPAQERAWSEIKDTIIMAATERPPKSLAPFVLHGVTGSGKTEIYLKALAQGVALGKRGIVLVPEIALTPQTISRFSSRFPGRVAVLHSGLSPGELFDEWWRIKDGEFSVVIGSRSAVFAPQPDLGLVVIDEEHEGTYKQEERVPRYHARDVALKLGELMGAVVILGSATPDLTTYHRAKDGVFKLLELPERATIRSQDGKAETKRGETGLPEVKVVDLRAELKAGNRSIFSRVLLDAMEFALDKEQQIILFLNRRGAATFVQCRSCGYVVRCRRCDLALAYHSAGEDLVCHVCNYRSKPPSFCPQCWSKKIRYLGAGTQKLEEEVKKMFPQARVLRWDRDVTQGRRSHELILDKFLAHQADILVGTQMIAKGLDLPLVTLVGVVNADVNLHLPDYRAAERTFQLVTQVAGRAGRGPAAGRVIIQTYNPGHYSIMAASQQDYPSFYHEEIPFRLKHWYPPFSNLARLLHLNPSAALAQKEATRMHQRLLEEQGTSGLADVAISGPLPAFIARVRGRYRWQIILRGKDTHQLLDRIGVPQGWAVDVDPVQVL